MALPERAAAPKLLGREKPRIAPPLPARSQVKDFVEVSTALGIKPYPWQRTAMRYITALAPGDRWLYPEVGIVVGRQNGKTTLLVPLVVSRLRAGHKIMHTAQNRSLPRDVFDQVAEIMSRDTALFSSRNGRPVKPRYANGQEEIRLTNGGIYRIVAPTRGGARGPSNDLVIVDELREMKDHDFIGGAEPTLLASPYPQMLYLSNAGEVDSVVLNAIRERADKDPSLAYLEWSAAPERAADDREGWLEANPSIGHRPGVIEYLERKHESHRLGGTLGIFETEHLSRWVNSLREPLVSEQAWSHAEATELEEPTRPYMAVSMDPSGTRASAALAWPQADGTIALRMLFDVRGDPIDTDRLGTDMREMARTRRVANVGFDPMTDAALARYFPKTEPVTGSKYANASSRFVSAVEAGTARWMDCAAVSEDLTWTARKAHEESGSFQAVRGNDDRPITATLAAIRAVWLASEPKPAPVVRKPRLPVSF